ncbi:MAG: phosphoribosylformylglycinamidine synthase subunit PurS [Elusimicrobiota bacterium]
MRRNNHRRNGKNGLRSATASGARDSAVKDGLPQARELTAVLPPPRKLAPAPELPRHLVEVATKYGMTDASGAALLSKIPSLGVQNAREVRVSALYEIVGKLTVNQVHQLSRELLSDPVTQEYRVERAMPSPAFLMGPHWRLEVWLKPALADPVGESVRKAVRDMGLPEPARVRTGTAYHILGRVNKAQVGSILEKLLSNPLIHKLKVIQR